MTSAMPHRAMLPRATYSSVMRIDALQALAEVCSVPPVWRPCAGAHIREPEYTAHVRILREVFAMNLRLMTCALLMVAVAAPGHAQDSMSANGFRNHALPVLVRVDSVGKVTLVLPSVQLSPRTDRLLRANLDQMITQPAKYRGRAVSSQFVIQLALVTEHKGDDTYSAHFEYVTAMPVPAGSWYWVHINGHRLALAEDDGSHRRFLHIDQDGPFWREVRPGPVMTSPAQAAPAAPVGFGTSQDGPRAMRRFGGP